MKLNSWITSLLLLGVGLTATERPVGGAPAAATGATEATEAAARRAAELSAEIARHDRLYFNAAAPAISDGAYDALKRELEAIGRAFPGLAASSAGTALGDDRTGLWPAVAHRVPMLGLDKADTIDELRRFDAALASRLGEGELHYLIEPKFDGLAVSATYEHGRLSRVVTRGNGTEGDDITPNVRGLAALPATLRAGPAGSVPAILEVRGELYLPLPAFAHLNAARERAGDPVHAHPRSLAAAVARARQPDEGVRRSLTVVFHGLGAWEPASTSPGTHREFRDRLRQLGLPVSGPLWTARGPGELEVAVLAAGRARSAWIFPSDGVVAKLDAIPLQRRAGATATAPRWAIAYKFAPERAQTRLRGIVIQVGRTGLLTPVAELEPVELGGTAVTRASLHNAEEIARHDFRLGDLVVVERAGDAIPVLAGVVLAARPSGAARYAFPATCPSCGQAVVHQAGEAARRCANAACPAQLRRRVEYFASEACVDIPGIGPSLVDALVDAGRLRSVADLYRLGPDDIDAVRAGRGAAMIAAIEHSKRAELWRFIAGLSIPRVGESAARNLARHFGSLEKLAAAQPADFAGPDGPAIPGVGEATSHSILEFFRAVANRDIVTQLRAAGVRPLAP